MSRSKKPVVLLVDDEPRVLSALRRGLRREGLAIVTADRARGALERLACDTIDLVISDYKMPGMNGIELLQTVRSKWPGTARILLSGWSSDIPRIELESAGLSALIVKPWNDADLRQSIRDAVGRDDD